MLCVSRTDQDEQLNLGNKLIALLQSRKSTEKLLQGFELDEVRDDEPAVILFTSGSESAPPRVYLPQKISLVTYLVQSMCLNSIVLQHSMVSSPFPFFWIYRHHPASDAQWDKGGLSSEPNRKQTNCTRLPLLWHHRCVVRPLL